MEDVYHSYYIDYSWRYDNDDYTHSSCHWGLIRHDELMAVISGGMPARKAFIESHSSLLYNEILDDVSMDYDLNRKFDKTGRALDGGPDWEDPSKKAASSSSSSKPKSGGSTTTKTSGGSSHTHSTPNVTPHSYPSYPSKQASKEEATPIIIGVIWLIGAVITFFIVRNESTLFGAILKSVGWTFIVAYYIFKYAWLLVVWIISLFK